MDYFDNIGDLGKNKEYLKEDFVVKECLKIRLYDGLFRSSDNILRNILVNSDGELLSIDEGDIFGKRKTVFNKGEWFKKTENFDKTRNVSQEIIEQFNLQEKINLVIKMLKVYGFNEDMISEAEHRFTNYAKIIKDELGN